MKIKATRIIEQQLNGERLTAFDVGAKGGVFPFPRLEKYFDFYGFEPNPVEFELLQRNHNNNHVSYFPFALSDKKGVRNLRIAKHSSYSSFLEFDAVNFAKHFGNMKDYEIWRQGMETEKIISVKTNSIDNVLQQEKITAIDFLKLDTQGTELEILRGAEQALKAGQIGVIFTEFSFIPSYVRQNLFSELEIYLRDLGYTLIDCRFYPDAVQKFHWPFTRSIYDPPRFSTGGDAVFVPTSIDENFDRVRAFKIGLITMALGYYGMAKPFFKHSHTTEAEIQLLFRSLQKFSFSGMAKTLLPPFLYQLLMQFFPMFIFQVKQKQSN